MPPYSSSSPLFRRSLALEFVAYSLGFFHDGHRATSDCQATLHALAQPLPGIRRLALQALLEQATLPTWRLWARDAAIGKKMSSKPEVTPGARESSGDQSAGIAMCQTPIGGGGVLAPSKRDGAGSRCMGLAYQGERSVLGSMLGLG